MADSPVATFHHSGGGIAILAISRLFYPLLPFCAFLSFFVTVPALLSSLHWGTSRMPEILLVIGLSLIVLGFLVLLGRRDGWCKVEDRSREELVISNKKPPQGSNVKAAQLSGDTG